MLGFSIGPAVDFANVTIVFERLNHCSQTEGLARACGTRDAEDLSSVHLKAQLYEIENLVALLLTELNFEGPLSFICIREFFNPCKSGLAFNVFADLGQLDIRVV